MAVLPESNTLNLPGGVEFSQPGLTWKINQETRRIEGTVDGYESVRQAVEIILYVERFPVMLALSCKEESQTHL